MAAEKRRTLSIDEFMQADPDSVLLIDLREPEAYLIGTLPGAVNNPASRFFEWLETLPREKPIYLFCYMGKLSNEVLRILLDRGYDAFELEDGYASYRALLNEGLHVDFSEIPLQEDAIDDGQQPIEIDAIGLKCPGPIIKVADTVKLLPYGARMLVKASEDAFFSDIKIWCERTGNRLLSLTFEDGLIEALIEKALPEDTENVHRPGDDKTMVIFSGDLDKTIAAFIIANGAAAMGRKVTMFFTFWGLNILRRPHHVSVAKSFIERAFGFMMPRGTRQLGLSRMNMLGIGPKMIRGIMKQKNIFSLEELIRQALEHDVRLVACQMSMDIMGIRKEELIDGIELGGVSTFIGSGELSDMSLFI